MCPLESVPLPNQVFNFHIKTPNDEFLHLHTYLYKHSELTAQLMSRDGSLASRLIHARHDMQVTGLPSHITVLKET